MNDVVTRRAPPASAARRIVSRSARIWGRLIGRFGTATSGSRSLRSFGQLTRKVVFGDSAPGCTARRSKESTRPARSEYADNFAGRGPLTPGRGGNVIAPT